MHRFQWINPPDSPPPPPDPMTVELVQTGFQASVFGGVSSFTFDPVTTGGPDSRREMMLLLAGRKYGGGSIDNLLASVTLNGISAVIDGQTRYTSGGFDRYIALARVAFTEGGNVPVVVTAVGSYLESCFMAAYRVLARSAKGVGATQFVNYGAGAATSHTLSGISQPDNGVTFVAGLCNTNRDPSSDPITLSAGWTKGAQVKGNAASPATLVAGHNIDGGLTSLTLGMPANLHMLMGAWSYDG